MKRLVLISALTLGAMSVKTADAQIGIHVNLRFGTPVYAPAPPPPPAEPVYDDNDDYYYLPEVEAYYSVPEHCYYYNDGYNWVSAAYLPGYYRNFDWRTARRVEIHANRPFMHHDSYRGKFGGFSNRADFYARAFPGRERPDARFDRRPQPQGYDNRGGWDRQPQGGFDRDHRNGYNQSQGNHGNWGGQPQQGGYNQPSQSGNHGNWGGQPQGDRGNNSQPQAPQGGYNQPSQGGGRGNWGGQGQQGGQPQGDRGNNGNQGQPSNQDRGQGQPAGDRGQGGQGQGRGNYGGGQQHFAERVGVVNDRVAGNRPGRL